MKTPSSSLVLLSLSLLSSVADALPKALPKAPWVEQYARTRGRKYFTSEVTRRALNTTEDPQDCVIQNAQDTTAPKKNIWGGLSGPEASSVVAWLFSQPEFNLTQSENATNWDNTM